MMCLDFKLGLVLPGEPSEQQWICYWIRPGRKYCCRADFQFWQANGGFPIDTKETREMLTWDLPKAQILVLESRENVNGRNLPETVHISMAKAEIMWRCYKHCSRSQDKSHVEWSITGDTADASHWWIWNLCWLLRHTQNIHLFDLRSRDHWFAAFK